MFKKLFFADLKMMVRNRQALLWAFMFPIIFSLIFGFFFGKSANSGTVALINNSTSEISKNYVSALKESEIFKIEEDIDLAKAKEDIKKSKFVAIVEIPEGFGQIPQPTEVPASSRTAPVKTEIPKQSVNFIVDPGNAQANAALTGFTEKFFSILNLKLQNAEEIFTINLEKTNDKDLSYYDFILAGILGLAIMNSSIIGISVSMTKYREDKILKRITTTPLPSSIFIISEVLSRLILNLVQILAVLGIGIYLFDANIYGNILILIAVAMVGALLFQLMGFVVAAFSKTTDAAQGLATFITIPMMFLAGVFFPIDSLPGWLAPIVSYLPLSPLLRILRAVALENNSPFIDMRNVAIVISWILASLLLSIWKFRLSDE